MDAVRSRLAAWWWARQPRRARVVLGHRNIYILPTAAGWMFGLTVLLMLVGSINYQLNLGYALTFWLLGAAVVSMHQTHRTLQGLMLHVGPVEPVHADQPAVLTVIVDAHPRARHGLTLSLRTSRGVRLGTGASGRVVTHTEAGQSHRVELLLPPTARGRHDLPGLRVETRFPFGLFRAWADWRPDGQRWVWPAAERPTPAWSGLARSGIAPPGTVRPTEPLAPSSGLLPMQALARSAPEPDGVRPWQRGDAMNRVVWKKSAAGGELVSRSLSAPPPPAHDAWLRWPDVARLGVEPGVQRLTAWLLQAQALSQPVGLELGTLRLAPGLGPVHDTRCLEALALWGLSPADRQRGPA